MKIVVYFSKGLNLKNDPLCVPHKDRSFVQYVIATDMSDTVACLFLHARKCYYL